VVAAISRAAPHQKIPEWEQVLSAGAVCMNMIVAARALGFSATWLTEWMAYDARFRVAIGLAEQIRAASAEIERGRRLPAGIAAAMKDAGVFGMAMPRAWGGLEVDPLTQFRIIEALAMADGSVGWCAMIGCDGGYMTAFLDQDVGRGRRAARRVAGGPDESVFQPSWSPDGDLYFVSDRGSGWWNLYRERDGAIEPLAPMEAAVPVPT